MSSLSSILLDKEILLESGTNELEMLVFDVADFTFGINVAKVREVLPTSEITSLPKAHPSIRGVFKLRDWVIPCVSLSDHLGIMPTVENPESTLILTDFNQQQVAFLVDSVDRIYRLSWEDILAVPALKALAETPVTALARCQKRLIVMLDFEKVLDDVTDQYFRTDAVANPLGLPREKLRIVLADDSATVREAVGETLRSSGYTRLESFENGAEAWNWIEQRIGQTGRAEDVADLVIADVEMPQVDGFHLTKRIKAHQALSQVPVLLYSSIITPDNHKKGKAVGADAQVSKPELDKVVLLADELISTAQQENRSAAFRELADTVELKVGSEQLGSGCGDPVPTEPTASQPAPSQPAAAAESDASRPGPTPAPQSPPPQAAQSRPPSPAAASSFQSLTVVPGPVGVSPRLWMTFHRELADHAARLRAMCKRAEEGSLEDEVLNEVLRTLHTVKSASMVVPLDPVSRCTHLIEGLMAPARSKRDCWPHAKLCRYVDWLDMLVSPPTDINAALAAGGALEAELVPDAAQQ